jgi:ribose-phosphate pyrophosphokinase
MQLKVFGIAGSEDFSSKVCSHLDIARSKHIEKHFDDGELYIRSDENVRGADVYVVCSLYGDQQLSVSEKLTSLLIFIGSLGDASAQRITVICPMVAFSRQDRKTESRAPITIKYVAQSLEAVGATRFLTMDVHNLSALQCAFRIPTDNLEARNLFIDFLVGVDRDGQKVETTVCEEMMPKDIVLLSPDSGGMSRTKWFARSLEKRLQIIHPKQTVGLAYFDKERISSTEIRGDEIIGDVKGKNVIIVDDLISSGRTIQLSGEAVKKFGGKLWAACATHGLFTGGAADNLAGIPRIVVADTVPPFRLVKSKKIEEKGWINVIPTAKLFASAIRRTHEDGGSISQLLQS